MVQKVLTKIFSGTTQKDDGFANLVGQFGRWQLLLFLSVFTIKFPTGWVQLTILFLTPKPVFWCTESASNGSFVGVNSTCYKDCVRYGYDASPLENTIVSEWGLVCERAWLASFTQTVLQLGILVGSIVFGFLSDRYGRKKTFLLAVVSLCALALGAPFAPDYASFTALRFCLGLATAGTMVVSFVIVMEVIGPKYREFFGTLYQIPFVTGHLTVPLVAYYFPRWNTYLLVFGVSNVVFLAYFFVLSESPRWLLSVGRVEEATVIVTKALKMNKLPCENVQESLEKLSLEMRKRDSEPRPNYAALLRPEMRVRTLASVAMWLVAGHTFFGFNQYTAQTTSNPFLSAVIGAVVQFPAIFASAVFMRVFGRKLTTTVSFLICGVSILALGFVPKIYSLTLTLATIGSGFASVISNCVYIYSSELFPTVARNMGIGASSMAMRVGSMIAPFVANLGSTAYWLPPLIFGVAPILASLVILLLPETNGKKLPDSIEELRADG